MQLIDGLAEKLPTETQVDGKGGQDFPVVLEVEGYVGFGERNLEVAVSEIEAARALKEGIEVVEDECPVVSGKIDAGGVLFVELATERDIMLGAGCICVVLNLGDLDDLGLGNIVWIAKAEVCGAFECNFSGA